MSKHNKPHHGNFASRVENKLKREILIYDKFFYLYIRYYVLKLEMSQVINTKVDTDVLKSFRLGAFMEIEPIVKHFYDIKEIVYETMKGHQKYYSDADFSLEKMFHMSRELYGGYVTPPIFNAKLTKMAMKTHIKKSVIQEITQEFSLIVKELREKVSDYYNAPIEVNTEIMIMCVYFIYDYFGISDCAYFDLPDFINGTLVNLSLRFE